MDYPFGAGALPSKRDIRTFAYPIQYYPKRKGGERYLPSEIEDQSKVGICTAIHLTQNAKRYYKQSFSADFQYLCQKVFYDKNWNEGSSILSAVKVGKNIGFLPEKEWKWTTQEDRTLGYAHYVKKLQAIPKAEIDRLVQIAKQGTAFILAYAEVPVDRNSMAHAIDNSNTGILARFKLGKEWWTDVNGIYTNRSDKLEPLRPPQKVISGHAVTISNFAGRSFRIANTWGTDWADKGTAYYLLEEYAPTECWSVWYNPKGAKTTQAMPKEIQQQLDNRYSGSLKSIIADKVQMVLEAIRNFFEKE